MLLDDAAL